VNISQPKLKSKKFDDDDDDGAADDDNNNNNGTFLAPAEGLLLAMHRYSICSRP